MSTTSNKDTVRRIYEELWNGRDLALADRLIAAGSVNYDTGLEARPFGPEQMRDTVRRITAAFPDHHHAVEELIAEDEVVVARCTLTATHTGPFQGIPPTGRRIAVNEIHIYRLAGGKVVEHRVGRDDLGALGQLGALPAGAPDPGAQ